ncbi:MAG: Bax inhibitor-1/YccA family protein [Magnetococcales bacterium]|nr:Bax inhibitor-1/YccA family protein [Magnetococcales bacterium]
MNSPNERTPSVSVSRERQEMRDGQSMASTAATMASQMNRTATGEGTAAGQQAVGDITANAITYLKQVYAYLAASMVIAVAAGTVGMGIPFVYEHPFIMMFLFFGGAMLAHWKPGPPTLFLASGLAGAMVAPMIALFLGNGMSHIVGQAAAMTGGIFLGLTFYALTTKRDFSFMGGMLFAGLIVLIVGGLINMFVQSTVMAMAFSAMGAMIFSGLILWETQTLKENPWALHPAAAAFSMFLNVFNLFINLLQLLGLMGGGDD